MSVKKLGMSLGMKVLGVSQLLHEYKESEEEIKKNGLWSTAVKKLNLSINVHPDQLNHIPAEGPLVIVSNHPFGGIDGIILSYLVEQRRKDFKVFVTNMLTEQFPAARPHFLDVELYKKDRSEKAKNKASLQAAIDYVKGGGALIIFPAGTPSQAKTPFAPAKDLPWRSGVAKIIHETQAKVVPTFFEGQNSVFFQSVGLIFKNKRSVRTLLLAKELLKRRDCETSVRIGSPIPYSQLQDFSVPECLAYLRKRVYLLKKPTEKQRKLTKLKNTLLPYKLRKSNHVHEIISPILPSRISDFLTKYKEDHPESLIVDGKRYKVFMVNGAEASEDFLLEIGRLREITFREAGEGTGKRCDLDEHDGIYHHLIVWNENKQWISGAYRLGLSPYVLKARGIQGFYCQPYFNLKEDFFQQAGDSVELGRSFVRKHEQSQWVLFFLWKGLATFLLQNPNYKNLFGSVSISNDYSERSRYLMAKYFLEKHRGSDQLNQLVKAEIPFDFSADVETQDLDDVLKKIDSIKTLAHLISDLEEDLKRIPVLVYRYAQLGAQYICFAVDPDFSNTLDGFIVVDIAKIPSEQLKKYLSEEDLKSFYDQRKS